MNKFSADALALPVPERLQLKLKTAVPAEGLEAGGVGTVVHEVFGQVNQIDSWHA